MNLMVTVMKYSLTFMVLCSECGCGSGDSGCKECGCCRVCAEDKDRWDGMFQMEGDEADLFSALKEKLKKRKERMKKKEKKENLGLQLLFGGLCIRSFILQLFGRKML